MQFRDAKKDRWTIDLDEAGIIAADMLGEHLGHEIDPDELDEGGG